MPGSHLPGDSGHQNNFSFAGGTLDHSTFLWRGTRAAVSYAPTCYSGNAAGPSPPLRLRLQFALRPFGIPVGQPLDSRRVFELTGQRSRSRSQCAHQPVRSRTERHSSRGRVSVSGRAAPKTPGGRKRHIPVSWVPGFGNISGHVRENFRLACGRKVLRSVNFSFAFRD